MRYALVVVVVLIAPITAQAPADTVYTIPGGALYHREDCISLTGHRKVPAKPKTRPITETCILCKPDGPIPQPAWWLEAMKRHPPAGQDAASTIRNRCATEWPEDFRMRAYCEELQRKGKAALDSRPMVSADQQTIRRTCQRERN